MWSMWFLIIIAVLVGFMPAFAATEIFDNALVLETYNKGIQKAHLLQILKTRCLENQ